MSEPRPPPPATGGSGGEPDGERDAWLREALRHAPDASLAAPAPLSRAILAEARAAAEAEATATLASHAATARTRGRVDPGRAASAGALAALASFWSWLARPPVAAGFASVMAATLVGLMWWDRPMDEAMPPASAPPAAQPAPAATLPAATPPAALQKREEDAERPAVKAQGRTGSNAPQPFPVLREPSPAPSTRPSAAKPAPASPEPAPPSTPRSQAKLADANRATTDAFEKDRSPPAAPPAPAPAGALAPPAELAPAPQPAPAPLQAPAPDAQRRRAAAAAGALESKAGAEASAATLGATAPSRDDATAAAPATAPRRVAPPEPLEPLLAELRGAPSRWSRATGDGRSVALAPALLRWLAELETSTAGRWTAADAGATGRLQVEPLAASPAESRRASQPRLAAAPDAAVLLRDGLPAASLRIEGGTVSLESRAAGGTTRSWRAELPRPAAERTRASLPPLPP